MRFRLLASTALLVSCLVPGVMAQTAIDATLNPDGSQVVQSIVNPLTPGSLGRASTAADDFNRASGTTMGPDWIEITGDMGILNNQGIGNAKGYMAHATTLAPYAGSSCAVDFFHSTTGPKLVYTALIAAQNPVGDFLFVKIQDNDSDGLYDRVFFYKNENGGNWGAIQYYFDLVTPTPSGRMILSFDSTGDVATLDIDNNFDGLIDDTGSANKILSSGLKLGSGFGIATFGGLSTYDNWSVNQGIGFKNYGSGVAGANGEPTLTLSASPQIGATPNLLAASSAVGAEQCILFVGFAQASVPGFWGGSLYLVPAVSVLLPMPAAGWTLPLPIPNNPAVVGLITYFQVLQSDPAAALGAASSRGLEVTIQP